MSIAVATWMKFSRVSGVELVVQDIRGGIQGHLLDFYGLAVGAVRGSADLQNRSFNGHAELGSFDTRGQAAADFLSEVNRCVPEIREPGVDPARPGIGTSDGRPGHQLVWKVGRCEHDGSLLQAVATGTCACRVAVCQAEDIRDVARWSDLFDADLVDAKCPIVVCVPNRLPGTPLVPGQALDAASPDGAERLDEDTCTLPGLREPLVPERAQSLPGGHHGYAVLRCKRILARQAVARCVLACFDRRLQIVGDPLVFGPLSALLIRHTSPYLASDPTAGRRCPLYVGAVSSDLRLADPGAYFSIEVIDIDREEVLTEDLDSEVGETLAIGFVALPTNSTAVAIPADREAHPMKVIRRPAASLATEAFDVETQELLAAVEVELPDFGDVDLDVAFGTPLSMYEAGLLRHERLEGLDREAANEAIEARENRMLAARDIAAADPSIASFVRERLADILLPYATQLRTAPPTAAPRPVAA